MRTGVQLDVEILAQLRRVGGEDLVQELIGLYRTHTPERMRRARKALAGGDLEQAAKAVHSLRSSSATLGASDLAAALGQLEAAANAGEAEKVGREWPGIEARVESLLQDLADHQGES